MRPETAVRKQDRGLRVFQQGVVTRLQPRACENVVYAFERGVGALVCSLLLKLKLANIERKTELRSWRDSQRVVQGRLLVRFSVPIGNVHRAQPWRPHPPCSSGFESLL